MIRVPSSTFVDASTLALALTEAYPDSYSSYGSVPSSEYGAALDAYQAYDEGVLYEAPLALDAYLEHQRNIQV